MANPATKDRHRVAITGRGERYIHKPTLLEDLLDQVGKAIEDHPVPSFAQRPR